MSFLEIKNIEKSFKQEKVLDNVSLTIEEGELISLLGPSGCGKTTLLRAIAGLISIEQGEIKLKEKLLTNLLPQEREVGMVFQSYALFPNLTVWENIAFSLRIKKMKENEIKENVNHLISLMHLNGKEEAYPRQLSGGQQQRVALARSLANNPKVLLLDEPFSALDAKIRKKLQIELRNLQQELKITTILVTHDQEEALSISDRIFVMDKGKIVQAGTPQELYTKPNNYFVANFIGEYNIFKKEDFQKITGKEYEANFIIVRPEVIRIYESKEELQGAYGQYLLTGRITQSSMMGNILRYQVNIGGVEFNVDQLHRRTNLLNIGRVIYLTIPEEEVIFINHR